MPRPPGTTDGRPCRYRKSPGCLETVARDDPICSACYRFLNRYQAIPPYDRAWRRAVDLYAERGHAWAIALRAEEGAVKAAWDRAPTAGDLRRPSGGPTTAAREIIAATRRRLEKAAD